MSAYYYLVAGLPELSLEDGKFSYTVSTFRTELYPSLTAEDKKIIDLFYLQFDNANLLALLKDKDATIATQGIFSSDELLELIDAVRTGDSPDKKYPVYLSRFITSYISLQAEDLYLAEDLLAAAYYDYAMKCKNKFFASWFEFNLNLNNILAALSARKYKMDVASCIVGQNEVCEALRSSNARDFGLNEILDYFEPLQRVAETDELVEREKKVDLLKWNWLENEAFFHYFTIERLFVFLLRLDMVERWTQLDKERGKDLFRQMIQNLKDEVQIPEEFRK